MKLNNRKIPKDEAEEIYEVRVTKTSKINDRDSK